MAVSVWIANLTRSPSGQMVGTVIVQPSNLTSFRIEIVFYDQGSEENNLHHIQAVLQRFSEAFSDALKRPLKIDGKQVAKK